MNIQDFIREIADFPKPGILFRDFNPLLQQPKAWNYAIRLLCDFCDDVQPDLIAGIESRGFIVGSALSQAQNIGFIPIRKAGKLPGEVIGVDYSLEYGSSRLEVQKDLIAKGVRVLIIDDLLATGGTASAAYKLLNSSYSKVVGFAFIIELSKLNGRNNIPKDIPIRSLVDYS